MPRVLRFFRTGLRQKPRVALVVGLAVFAATALYTFTRPKIYEATASITVSQPAGNTSPPLSADYFDRLLKAANSTLILRRVADCLAPGEVPSSTVAEHEKRIATLAAQRRFTMDASSGLLSIHIRDRDPSHAVELADRFIYEMPHQRDDRPDLIILATTPDAPVSPNIPLHLATGLLAALAFGPLAAALAARRSVPRDPTSET